MLSRYEQYKQFTIDKGIALGQNFAIETEAEYNNRMEKLPRTIRSKTLAEYDQGYHATALATHERNEKYFLEPIS